MRKFAIITDSTCDLDKHIRETYEIDYVPMNFTIDGKEYLASLDWDQISPKDFYNVMRNGKRIYTTQVSRDTFINKFKYYLDQDMDILYIACSSALSGSINVGQLVADELLEEYKDAKIICIDSKISSLGEGFLAMTASIHKKEGQSIENVAGTINNFKLSMNQFGTVETLDHLKAAGRIKASKAFFGNLFGVKPIIISDAKGQNFAYKKVKGRRTSLVTLVEDLKDALVNADKQVIGISHADCEEDAMYVKRLIKEEIPCKGVYVNYIGPIVGASVGPGTIIIYGFGKEVDIVGEE